MKDATAPTELRESLSLLDVKSVASICFCSTRHIYRLADADRMPRPIRLGALVRWRRQTIEDWIAAGCPSANEHTT